jgi:predicted phosphodiesterase
MSQKSITVGVISDTHGLLRPEATHALKGAELILHAGDVGNPAVLDGLRAIFADCRHSRQRRHGRVGERTARD